MDKIDDSCEIDFSDLLDEIDLGFDEAQSCLDQIQDISAKALSHLEFHSGLRRFESDRKKPVKEGIQYLRGDISEDNQEVHLHFEVARYPEKARVSLGKFMGHISSLGDKLKIGSKPPVETSNTGFWVEMRVKATPICLTRSTAISEEIQRINGLAKSLQQDIPLVRDSLQELEIYSKFDGVLVPTSVLHDDLKIKDPGLENWVEEVCGYLKSNLNVAMVSDENISLSYSLQYLSSKLQRINLSLGQVTPSAINPKLLLDITSKAPGIVTLPALSLRLNSNPYNMGNEMEAMLQSLQATMSPVIFTGSWQQLQGVFQGGQGAVQDSLSPVISHVPKIEEAILVKHQVRKAAARLGGFSPNDETEVGEHIQAHLEDLSQGEKRRFLEMLSSWSVREWDEKQRVSKEGTHDLLEKLKSRSQTFSGLNVSPIAKRSNSVEENLVSQLADDGLEKFLLSRLLGQDEAIRSLCQKLKMEALTRPSNQPLRYCAQGTPGTGKSESASLLAKYLNIPFVNIDAASMPDYHTAASQLLGSGRGIVMSFKAGRLEEVAKHHQGAVVEISDLDHANPSVRSFLADLFLQVLETGEAQSATGAMFSCANVIFAFTMNLPDGADERIHSSLGFNQLVTDQEATRRVVTEIKDMLSGAFLSRVGNPILFKSLSDDSLSEILFLTVKKSVETALLRTGINKNRIEFSDDIGKGLLTSFKTNVTTFGARALLEYGRMAVAEAVSDLFSKKDEEDYKSLSLSVSKEGKLQINTKIGE